MKPVIRKQPLLTRYLKLLESRESRRIRVVEYYINWDVFRNLRGKLLLSYILLHEDSVKKYIKNYFTKVIFKDLSEWRGHTVN